MVLNHPIAFPNEQVEEPDAQIKSLAAKLYQPIQEAIPEILDNKFELQLDTPHSCLIKVRNLDSHGARGIEIIILITRDRGERALELYLKVDENNELLQISGTDHTKGDHSTIFTYPQNQNHCPNSTELLNILLDIEQKYGLTIRNQCEMIAAPKRALKRRSLLSTLLAKASTYFRNSSQTN